METQVRYRQSYHANHLHLIKIVRLIARDGCVEVRYEHRIVSQKHAARQGCVEHAVAEVEVMIARVRQDARVIVESLSKKGVGS